jgi:hypothetical protein
LSHNIHYYLQFIILTEIIALSNSSYNILTSKLNGFIKKYYKNLIIKGSILSLGIIVLLFILISIFEYLSWSNSLTRTIVFYSFLILVSLIIVYWIIIPALKLLRLGNVLSHEDAAKIIGTHFPNVSDKLLNAIQLNKIAGAQSQELLAASIDQKTSELSPIPFRRAISYGTNLKYLKFVAPPILLIILLVLTAPSIILEPAERLINHRQNFIKPLPYKLELLNDKFESAQHSDYSVRIAVKGDEIPSKIWVGQDGFKYRAIEVRPGVFEYVFKDVINSLYFSLITDDYQSEKYKVSIFPRPVIFSFNVELSYQPYLQVADETIENTGDLIVPEGTKLTWHIFTKDTRNIGFKEGDDFFILEKNESNVFTHSTLAAKDFGYSVVASNEFMTSADSMGFNVQIIKDEFPLITINKYGDEQSFGLVNFSGIISDDHGFYALRFFHRKDSIPAKPWEYKALLIDKNISRQSFDYMLLFQELNLAPGESLKYFFEVRDNDAFNGFKKTRSEIFTFSMPDSKELEEKAEEASDQLKAKLSNSIRGLDDLNKQIESTRLNLFEKKELSWADKKQLEELIEKEEGLKKQVEDMQKLKDEIKELEDMLKMNMSPELIEKLQRLESLFDDLFNKELQEELENLKEDLKKENLDEFLERMKEENQDLKSDIEQSLELYKQMEVEQLMEKAIEEMENLSKKEDNLSKETEDKKNSKQEGIKKQKEIQEKFTELMETIEEAEKLNTELEDPFNMEMDESSPDEISQKMDEAQENLEKNKKNKASENQKDAGKKMKDMADALSAMMSAAMEERMGEDIEQIRNMLDNLLDLSFAQERLMKKLTGITKNDPKNSDIRDDQKNIKDDFVIINDSLMAMSKRQIAIQPFVVKEAGKINEHIARALQNMQEQNLGQATSQQQYAMTSMNNLSLMLAESLEQMEQSMQMSGNKKGSKNCKSPGKGKSPSMSEIMKQQQGLNKGMQGRMKKNGLTGKTGLNKKSEELARMAAIQGEIRRMLQEVIDGLESQGGNGSSLNKIVDEMKKTEEDIVNRRITQETYNRQKNIETRLLKSDKAMQEREKEKKRESQEGKNRNSGNQNNEIEYKVEKENQEEILITAPIEVRPYYRKLLREYLYKLENNNNNGEQ